MVGTVYTETREFTGLQGKKLISVLAGTGSVTLEVEHGDDNWITFDTITSDTFKVVNFGYGRVFRVTVSGDASFATANVGGTLSTLSTVGGPVVAGGVETLATPVDFGVTLQRDGSVFSIAENAADYLATFTGTNLTVGSSADYTTIDAAVAAAEDGDRIILTAGEAHAMPVNPITKSVALLRSDDSGFALVSDGSPFSDDTDWFQWQSNWNGAYGARNATTTDYRLMVDLDAGGSNIDGVLGGGYNSYPGSLAGLAYWADRGYSGLYSSVYWLTDADQISSVAQLQSRNIYAVRSLNDTKMQLTGVNKTVFIGEGVVVAGYDNDATGIVVVDASTTLVLDRSHIYCGGSTGLYVHGNLIAFASTHAGNTNNAIDYLDTAIGVEVDIVSMMSGANASTAHGNAHVLRVNGTYGAAPRPLHDINSGYVLNCGVTVRTGADDGASTFAIRYGNDGVTNTTQGVVAGLVIDGDVSDVSVETSGVVHQIAADGVWPYS